LFKKGFDEISRCCALLRSAKFENQSFHEVYEQLLQENSSFRRYRMLISLSLTRTNSRSIVASIEDLHGTALHLSADLQGAKEAYQNSLAIVPLPAGFEASLKLASIFVEIGTNEEVFVLRCATSQ
jgi:hypothetical protein